MCLLFYIVGALVWAKSLQRALKPYPTLLAVQNHQWLVSASIPRAGYCSLCGQSPSAARWCVAHSIQERGGAFPRAALGCKAWLRGPRRLRPCRCSVAEGAGPEPGEGALAGPCAGAGSGAAAGPQRGSRGSAGLTGLSWAQRGSAGLSWAHGAPQCQRPEQRCASEGRALPTSCAHATYFMNQVCGQCFERFVRCSFMGFFSLRFAM